jgi:hypothetical protein
MTDGDRPMQFGGGIQYHHQTPLVHASDHAVNMVQSLKTVALLTGAPEDIVLRDDAEALCTRIAEAIRLTQEGLVHLWQSDPQRFLRCRGGLEPWPGEIAEGFVPICTCDRRCLFHVTGAPWASEADCNCADVCPRHQIPRVEGDREAVLTLPPMPEEFRRAGPLP